MQSPELVVVTREQGVTTLRFNDPRRLNGWTRPMMEALREAMARAEEDPGTKVVILTGTGDYYCAGVNLSGAMKAGNPRALRDQIVRDNEALFNLFIDFPKPILVAANGPAIGAAVTSATCCDAIIAAEEATFSTPFARLGVTPEGTSSVMFPRRLGAKAARRMLGPEGWVPTAREAMAIDLVQWVVPQKRLMKEAHKVAQSWIEAGAQRRYRNNATRDKLRAINKRESLPLANSFFGARFLRNQAAFLWSRKKYGPALTFMGLLVTRPVWSLLLLGEPSKD